MCLCVRVWVCTQDLNPALGPLTQQRNSLHLPPPSLLPQDSKSCFPPLARCSSEQGTEGLCLYQVLLFTMALNKYSAKASRQCKFVFLSTIFSSEAKLKPEVQYCSVCRSHCRTSCGTGAGQFCLLRVLPCPACRKAAQLGVSSPQGRTVRALGVGQSMRTAVWQQEPTAQPCCCPGPALPLQPHTAMEPPMSYTTPQLLTLLLLEVFTTHRPQGKATSQ